MSEPGATMERYCSSYYDNHGLYNDGFPCPSDKYCCQTKDGSGKMCCSLPTPTDSTENANDNNNNNEGAAQRARRPLPHAHTPTTKPTSYLLSTLQNTNNNNNNNFRQLAPNSLATPSSIMYAPSSLPFFISNSSVIAIVCVAALVLALVTLAIAVCVHRCCRSNRRHSQFKSVTVAKSTKSDRNRKSDNQHNNISSSSSSSSSKNGGDVSDSTFSPGKAGGTTAMILTASLKDDGFSSVHTHGKSNNNNNKNKSSNNNNSNINNNNACRNSSSSSCASSSITSSTSTSPKTNEITVSCGGESGAGDDYDNDSHKILSSFDVTSTTTSGASGASGGQHTNTSVLLSSSSSSSGHNHTNHHHHHQQQQQQQQQRQHTLNNYLHHGFANRLVNINEQQSQQQQRSLLSSNIYSNIGGMVPPGMSGLSSYMAGNTMGSSSGGSHTGSLCTPNALLLNGNSSANTTQTSFAASANLLLSQNVNTNMTDLDFDEHDERLDNDDEVSPNAARDAVDGDDEDFIESTSSNLEFLKAHSLFNQMPLNYYPSLKINPILKNKLDDILQYSSGNTSNQANTSLNKNNSGSTVINNLTPSLNQHHQHQQATQSPLQSSNGLAATSNLLDFRFSTFLPPIYIKNNELI